jgi:hypothetical protein
VAGNYRTVGRVRFRRLTWLSPRTARLKWSRRWWLRWWCVFRSNLGKPRRWTIHRRPLLGFVRKPSPSPSHDEQDVAHSRVSRLICHLLALGGAVPAGFRSEHGQSPEGTSRIPQKKTPPRPGGPAGFIAWQVWGSGASAKLAQQPKTDLNVPKIFGQRRSLRQLLLFGF